MAQKLTRFRQPSGQYLGDNVIVRPFPFPGPREGEKEVVRTLDVKAYTEDKRILVVCSSGYRSKDTQYFIVVRTGHKPHKSDFQYGENYYWDTTSTYRRYEPVAAHSLARAIKDAGEIDLSEHDDPWRLYLHADTEPFVRMAQAVLKEGDESNRHYRHDEYRFAYTAVNKASTILAKGQCGVNLNDTRNVALLYADAVTFIGERSPERLVRVVVSNERGDLTERDVLPTESLGGTVLSDGSHVLAEGTLVDYLLARRTAEREAWVRTALEHRKRLHDALTHIQGRVQGHLDTMAKGQVPYGSFGRLYLADQHLEEASAYAAKYQEHMQQAYTLGIPQYVVDRVAAGNLSEWRTDLESLLNHEHDLAEED